jgi:hypothetical protein
METIDLAKLASRAVVSPPHALAPWHDPKIWAGDKLTGGEVTISTREDLFQILQGPARWDFIVADIEGGKRWLASRLFIFAILLKEIRGLRFVVIVQSDVGVERKLLGVTTPDEVQSALAARCPWFDEQLLKAANAAGVNVFRGRTSLAQARTVLDVFINDLQKPQPGNNGMEWSEIASIPPLWERSPWLTSKRVISDLSGSFYDPRESTIQRESVHADFNLYCDIMRRREPCVAIVNAKGQFLDLFPKQAIVDRLLDQFNSAVGAAAAASGTIHIGELTMGDKTTTTTISGGTIGAVTSGGTAHIGNINQTINGLLKKMRPKVLARR